MRAPCVLNRPRLQKCILCKVLKLKFNLDLDGLAASASAVNEAPIDGNNSRVACARSTHY